MIKVPKRMRFALDCEEMNILFQKRSTRFKRSLLKALTLYTGYKEALKILVIEYKTFENTNTAVEEIRCDDKVIGIIYATRTEFNHQEVLWVAFPDAFKSIKKGLKEWLKRM